ncbi:MAG: hypothetical protein AB7D35_05120 [Bacteroidales bacterium]|jgi:hypothetical protein|nr:hypothetical protein [Bacteroidales bacterium]MDD4087021.1 hypothetical protein [Bacteroidales bacterium]
MKARLKKPLLELLGFDRFLFLFSLFISNTLKWNKKTGEFVLYSLQADLED